MDSIYIKSKYTLIFAVIFKDLWVSQKKLKDDELLE